MDIGWVEAGGGRDFEVHCGTEGEVAAETDSDDAEFAVAVGEGGEVVDESSRIAVVGGDLLFELVEVAFVCTSLVIGEDGAGRFEFVINLWDRDDVSMAGEEGGGAADGSSELEDF